MSYLNPIRLHFSGQFQADPSTVNNDVRHFNNATFQPQFQQPQSGQFLNGWWNPEGSGAFRLVACTVSLVCYADGTSSQTDPAVGLAVADANVRVAGKIVDLDPQQQMVSEIWGLIVRLTDGNSDLFSGPFAVAPFSDIWFRAQGPGAQGDMGMGTFWQSVVGPVTWGETSGSPFLTQLRAAAPDGLLSIKFNTDGYNMNATSAQFTLGRVAGTIGPASPSEPRRFVLGRQLLPQIAQGAPAGPMNFMPAVVDTANRKVLADLGNALPTQRPGGPLTNIGDLQLGYLDAADAFHSLGTLPAATYGQANSQFSWYTTTAGIQAFPPDRALTDTELSAVASHRLAVTVGGTMTVQENFEGLYVRADQFVFRLDPGQTANVQLWAAQYGVPLANARVVVFRDTSGLQPGGGDPNDGLGAPPPFGTPRTAITFRAPAPTDAQGRTTLAISGSDPGNPRGYIDGQVYGVRYLLRAIAEQLKTPLDSNFDPPFGWNPSDFVSLLVFDPCPVPPEPTWYGLQLIWQSYANLYPVMGRVLNLSQYEDVAAHAQILAFAYALPRENPNHMPVTRDLSRGRRDAILRWLTRPGPDGKPVLGLPPVPPAPPPPWRLTAAARPPAPAGPPAAGAPDPREGAKAYARSLRGRFRIPDNFDE